MILWHNIEPWWPSDYEFESHHPYLFDKKFKQKIALQVSSSKSMLEK
jgi:hypothetical protein